MDKTIAGWNDSLQNKWNTIKTEHTEPARIIWQGRGYWRIQTAEARELARLDNRMTDEVPAVGDWAAVSRTGDETAPWRIHELLPRKSFLSRRQSGNETKQQALAANMDTVCIVFSLEGGRKYAPGAIERYATAVWDSGAEPLIVLNKSDLCDDTEQALLLAEENAPGVRVVMISCLKGEGLANLESELKPGTTSVFIGPSGTGKSTIINTLSGRELLETGAIRESDKKGRHTTSHRELFVLDNGSILIDTPGLRELQLWTEESSLEGSFPEIAELSEECRFSDCSHETEPGCAVQQALSDGLLTTRRFDNYLSLKKELAYLHRQTDYQARKEHTDRWKQIIKSAKTFKKNNR